MLTCRRNVRERLHKRKIFGVNFDFRMLGICTRAPLPTPFKRLTHTCTHLLTTSDQSVAFGQPHDLRSSNSQDEPCYDFQHDTRDGDLACRGADAQSLRWRRRGHSFGRAMELRPKGESRRSAPKLAAEGDQRWGGYLESDHSRDRAPYRHGGPLN
jgi:hypothetical protein